MPVRAAAAMTFNPVHDVAELLAYHFMVNAFVAGTIVAIVAAAAGWFMVLRQEAFVGHTLAVVGFPGAAGATLIGVAPSLGYFGVCAAAALVIAGAPAGRGAQQGDTAVVGTVQAFALATGVWFTSLSHGFLTSATALLFGSFLGVTDAQVRTLGLVCVAALLVLAVIARPLFFATVDADVARVRGVRVGALSATYLVVLAVAIAGASEITGSLLVFSLLVMPPAAAGRLVREPGSALVLAIAISVGVAWASLASAYETPLPVGFYLTTYGFAALAVGTAVERLRRRVA